MSLCLLIQIKITSHERSGKIDHWQKKAAVVTFNNGYKSNYEYAFPILKKYGIPATIFLATGHIDTGVLFWWDKIRYALWRTQQQRLVVDELGAFTLSSLNEKRQKILYVCIISIKLTTNLTVFRYKLQ